MKQKSAQIKKKQEKATPAKVVPPKKVEEDESEEEDEVDSGADLAVADLAEQNSEEESVEEAENNEEGDDADSDDEAPVEEPIGKAKAVAGGIPKINTGNVPADMPDDQVLIVKNLPSKFKQVDIVEVFAKYGTIHTIKPNYGKEHSNAFVAFTTAEAALAAIAAHQTAKVKGNTIAVIAKKSKKPKKLADRANIEEERKQIEESKDRTVYVKNLKVDTTEEQLKEHFENSGTVELVKVMTRKQFTFGFVTFDDAAAVEEAKKLHNSQLNGAVIGVFHRGDDQSRTNTKDPERTILIKNTQQLESFAVDQLTEAFSKCGEILNIDVLCKKNVLAFITFKNETSVPKALKLNGSTVGDLELELEQYKVPVAAPKTSVFVQNVKPGVTEEDIRELFESSGPIDTVFVRSGFAIVKFKTSEGFCQSFLKNESLLQGQIVFLEPYSDKKQNILKKNYKSQMGGKRRPPMPHMGGQKRFKQN